MRAAALALAALLLAGAAAPAGAQTHIVSMGTSSFSPARLDVLVGDSVVWRNNSLRTHDIQSLAAGFDSGRVAPGEGFGHAFDVPGTFDFVCTIHDGMTGELTVHSLLLHGPERAVPRGTPVALRVRAPEGVTEVTIEEDTGHGFHAVATARPAPKGESDGALVATIVPPAGASYRAVAGELVSAPLRVEVSNETAVALRASARAGGALVGVRAPGALPGTRVVLQLRLRERFGWWPVARARLDARSRASFVLKRRRPVRARAVLVGEDWATPLSMSAALTVDPRR